MNNLGVFVFFDKQGIVDEYAEFILKELGECVNRLIIVVNGEITKEGSDILRKYSSELIIRDNCGLDAGAYADVFVEYLGADQIRCLDELVLCNDTFYGPFIKLKTIFNEMRGRNLDFWGIDIIERDFLSYIITYFCVFEKKALENNELYEYFSKYIYRKINNRSDAFALFEVGLYNNFVKKNFKVGSYTNSKGHVCAIRPDICIKDYGLPLLKKKFFEKDYFDDTIGAQVLDYVKGKYGYNTEFIKKNVKRLYGVEFDREYKNEALSDPQEYYIPQITYTDILTFIRQYKKISIYGTGAFAKATYFVFRDEISEFEGFIISDKTEQKVWGHKVTCISEADRNIAILVALNRENSLQVKDKLSGYRTLFFWNKWQREN